MRKITAHLVAGVPLAAPPLKIEALDEPGAGGANHHYEISGFDAGADTPQGSGYLAIHFQNGPIAEAGINGITQEALLAIVIDRLTSFQNGPFACHENSHALKHARAALECLHTHTRDRMRRQVEGKNEL